MKCVCPMGGDRTCPDDCLLAVWANLPEADRPARRKPIAKKLYEQGFTQTQIATQLGVSQRQISTDLDLEVASKSKHAKTASNPKGSGRRPGKRQTKTRTAPTSDNAQKMAEAVLDEGKTLEQAALDFGVPSVQHVKLAVAKEEGRREPKADRSDLSISAQQKFDVAINAYKRKLDSEYNDRVNEGANKLLDEIILPQWNKRIADARRLYNQRGGILKTKREYNLILGCLHPDSRLSVSDERLGEAFRLFNSLEKYLLDESQSPTDFERPLPRTMAEWDRMKAAATTERKAKRHANKQSVRPR